MKLLTTEEKEGGGFKTLCRNFASLDDVDFVVSCKRCSLEIRKKKKKSKHIVVCKPSNQAMFISFCALFSLCSFEL